MHATWNSTSSTSCQHADAWTHTFTSTCIAAMTWHIHSQAHMLTHLCSPPPAIIWHMGCAPFVVARVRVQRAVSSSSSSSGVPAHVIAVLRYLLPILLLSLMYRVPSHRTPRWQHVHHDSTAQKHTQKRHGTPATAQHSTAQHSTDQHHTQAQRTCIRTCTDQHVNGKCESSGAAMDAACLPLGPEHRDT